MCEEERCEEERCEEEEEAVRSGSNARGEQTCTCKRTSAHLALEQEHEVARGVALAEDDFARHEGEWLEQREEREAEVRVEKVEDR